MERVPQLVRRGKKDRRMGAPSELDWEAIEALRTEMRVELIQELIHSQDPGVHGLQREGESLGIVDGAKIDDYRRVS